MASKPRSQWSDAYAKRMAREEAKSRAAGRPFDKQSARGHTKAEHVVRREGGAKVLRIAGTLTETILNWVMNPVRAAGKAAKKLAQTVGLAPAPATPPPPKKGAAPPRSVPPKRPQTKAEIAAERKAAETSGALTTRQLWEIGKFAEKQAAKMPPGRNDPNKVAAGMIAYAEKHGYAGFRKNVVEAQRRFAARRVREVARGEYFSGMRGWEYLYDYADEHDIPDPFWLVYGS